MTILDTRFVLIVKGRLLARSDTAAAAEDSVAVWAADSCSQST